MDTKILSQSLLFQGISADEINLLLNCLQAETRQFHRGEIIYHAGEKTSCIGLVLCGSVSIENDDIWGNKSILDKATVGEVFAEAYACLPDTALMISVVAAENSDILFMDVSRVLSVCNNSCPFHGKLVRSLLSISSQKNLNLSRRIFHTSCKSIRGRLLSYLSFQATQHKSMEFSIPFNRQQLADYLSVDRSALSNELSKMQKDGLLQLDRNHFILTGIDTKYNL